MLCRNTALVRTTAVLLLASLVSALATACKKEPASAGPPAVAAPMTWRERALADINQRISQFHLTITYDRGRQRFSTGVVLTVPPRDLPSEASGALGVDVVRISEPTARRLVERLARE